MREPITDETNTIIQEDKGVILMPPEKIHLDIRGLVAKELLKEPQTVNGIGLRVSLDNGVNFVFAHRTKNDWEIDFYAGSDWDFNKKVEFQVIKRW